MAAFWTNRVCAPWRKSIFQTKGRETIDRARSRAGRNGSRVALLHHHRFFVAELAAIFCAVCPMIICNAFNPSVRAAGPGCRMSGDLIS
jgi:hypothetical protein